MARVITRRTASTAGSRQTACGSCHHASDRLDARAKTHLRVALIGSPNVGKSALFNRLTGRYVTVSNYPGTSVEISRGAGLIGERHVEVLDTPGLYSLTSTTEEQRAVRRFLLDGGADVLVQVVDAKNVPRMLALTLQLVELGRPMVVAVNMMDEAQRLGLVLDAPGLSQRLGVPVVPIVAVEGSGISDLKRAILAATRGPVPLPPVYGNGVGAAIRAVRAELTGTYPVDGAALAALLIQGDAEVVSAVREREADRGARAVAVARAYAAGFAEPPAYRVAVERQHAAERLAAGVVRSTNGRRAEWGSKLGRLLARPVTGIPVLLLVVYLGLYQFVGQFGGGTVAALRNTRVYEQLGLPFGVYGTDGYIDNSWFSLWGETGTLGLLFYLWVYLGLFAYALRLHRRSQDAFTRSLALGFAAAQIGIAFNALLSTLLEIRTSAY
ncbi:MAG: 50S ribosome-binding GTPase, partial [Gemmatimonadetes bacterium]|nr:50S ribosome-binding GTPase [Gemmatimonadota bacterium]